jgi:DNA replication and repair protein RecF
VIVSRARLSNVRCHQTLDIGFGTELSVIVGGNGAGKTSVLEAVYFGLRGYSPRATGIKDLIRAGQEYLRVELDLVGAEEDEPFAATAVAAADAAGNRRILADGTPLPDFSRWVDHVPVRAFFPDDLRIVKGSPGRRRRFLDEIAGARQPGYASSLRNYQQALEQRNALLRQGVVGGEHGPWESILAREGLRLVVLRERTLATLAPLFGAMYSRLSGDLLGVSSLAYRTNAAGLDEEGYRARLGGMREADRRRSFTHVGPHRDDVVFGLRGIDVRESGSQGEQRLCLLSLLFAERYWAGQDHDRLPLLLLDDVMSELDANRRRALVSMLTAGGQAVVTATDLHHFTSEELEKMDVIRL